MPKDSVLHSGSIQLPLLNRMMGSKQGAAPVENARFMQVRLLGHTERRTRKIHPSPSSSPPYPRTDSRKDWHLGTADSRAMVAPSQVQARNVGQSGRGDAGPLARCRGNALAAGRGRHGTPGRRCALLAVVGQRSTGGHQQQRRRQQQPQQQQQPAITLQGPRPLPISRQRAPS